MNRSQLGIVAAGSAVVLLAAIYFGARSPTSRSVSADAPAPTGGSTPTSVHEPATVTRADPPSASADAPEQTPAPDHPAAVADQAHGSGSEFRELRECVYASRELITAKHLSDCRAYENKPEFEITLAECMNERANAQKRITAAEAVLSHCDQADLGSRYFSATKQAAMRGDVDAQLCYLQGDFFSPEGVQIFTEAENEQYKKEAPRYVDAAMKRGDWRVVDLLNTRRFHPGSGPLRLLEGVGDRGTQYKMTKLLRLGASGSYANFLEGRLKDMVHPDLNPSAALPAQSVREGDAWAQQTYNEYFAGVPGLTEAPVVCAPELGSPGRASDPTHPAGP